MSREEQGLTADRASAPRWGAWVIVLVVVIGAGVALYRLAGRQELPPHVIVISLDTTRRDHFGCYGNEWIRTPNIDRLAAESILFTRYGTVATTTLASHTSLFTGQYPHTHGVPRNGFVVSDENVMLAEILKEAGYETVGVLGAFVLDSRFGFSQGFDHYDENFGVMGDDGEGANRRDAAAVTDAAIAQLESAGVPEKLFLFAHYFDPHMVYKAPPPYGEMYGEREGILPVPADAHPALVGGRQPWELRKMLYRYAGEVSYMDEHVGRLLDYLRRKGILDRAVVVITSDHGENLTDRPGEQFDHGWTVYGFEQRAVCMVRLPGAARGGTRYDSLTASVDVLPTLTKYLGLSTPSGIDGEALDLRELAAPAQPPTRFAEATKPSGPGKIGEQWPNLEKPRCAERGRYKYIQTLSQSSAELYDVVADPYERYNLLVNPTAEALAVAAELRAALQAWSVSANPLPTRFEPAHRQETLRWLRSLGYVGDDDEGGD